MRLSVFGLSFSYREAPVLKDVSFELEGGELLAVLGPNGVGKTTLLKCINAIHRPESGMIKLGDRDVLSLRPSEIAAAIGYVAQRLETAKLTVFDAVLMGRKPHIRWWVGEKDLRIVESALRQLHLSHLALRHIDCLSGGELQKVSVARALVQEPGLLLLDEPTSALDFKSQIDILNQLRYVVTEHGIGALMSVHDINTALRYADKVLFLKDGRIHFTGSPMDVTTQVVEEVYGLPVHIQAVRGYPTVVPAQKWER